MFDLSNPPADLTFEQLVEAFPRIDQLPLECDGMTFVLAYLLNHTKTSFTIYGGIVTWTARSQTVFPHYWIEVLDPEKKPLILDLRARMWLGDEPAVPHGLFSEGDFPGLVYKGSPVSALQDVPKVIYLILVNPSPPVFSPLG